MRALIPAILAMVACSAADPALDMARSAATFVSEADPRLRRLYEAEQTACLTTAEPAACVAKVRADWAPIKAGLAEIRAKWCALEPQKCDKGVIQ